MTRGDTLRRELELAERRLARFRPSDPLETMAAEDELRRRIRAIRAELRELPR